MIAFLTGKFIQKQPTHVVVDVHGVGYMVGISLNTFSAIEQKSEGSLFIHTKVSEDAIALFGFATQDELLLFEKLIGVNGVGANTARIMLSHMKPDELRQAIVQGNALQLEKIKGIGKKTAERIVLELRDKLGLAKVNMGTSTTVGNTIQSDALEALVALGIPRNTATAAINKIPLDSENVSSVEMMIKQVLKSL